jgi:hypothetical protein
VAGAILAGCGHTPRRAAAPTYTAQYPAEPYPQLEQPTVAGLDATLGPLANAPTARTKPVNVLAVCAGGADTSFMAGALVGWTQSGTRPTFDVVTGMSGGALVGAFAFLGPKYDSHLRRLFTDFSTSDLLRVRPVRYLLRTGAIGSPEPLERLLEAEVNESFLADLRDAHAQGRRLFIGTTNFDTKRLTVWDLGAIASSGRPETAALVRKIFLASVTWAGMLPPVEFQVEVDGRRCCEHHIDGGATAQAFVRFGPTPGWPNPEEPAPGWLAGSNLYVLAGGKLYATPAPAPDRFFGRILTGVSCLTNSLARADMHRLYALCMSSGMRFHLLAVPQDDPDTRPNLLRLNPAEAQRMFDVGYRLTATGPAWRRTPPGAEPGEEEVPRGALAGCSFR